MAINKVEYGSKILIDLTKDTVSPDTLLAGTTAHNRKGEIIQGVAQPTTNDHSVLINRNLPDQHSIESITGLQENLNKIQNKKNYIAQDTPPEDTNILWIDTADKTQQSPLFWVGTAQEYEKIPVKDDKVLYFIKGDLTQEYSYELLDV